MAGNEACNQGQWGERERERNGQTRVIMTLQSRCQRRAAEKSLASASARGYPLRCEFWWSAAGALQRRLATQASVLFRACLPIIAGWAFLEAHNNARLRALVGEENACP